MAVTLSYGYIKNQTGDRGNVFWPDLEFNIQRTNDHNHDGVNSAIISGSGVASVKQSVAAPGWGALGGGSFSKTVTVSAGVDLDVKVPSFEDTSGNSLALKYQKLTPTTFDVFSNDNTLAIEVYYL